MYRDDKNNGEVMPLEQLWIQSGIHSGVYNENTFNDAMFERILGDTKLDVLKEIRDSGGKPTTLLKEWLRKARLTNKWLLKKIKEDAHHYDGESVWDVIKNSILIISAGNENICKKF